MNITLPFSHMILKFLPKLLHITLNGQRCGISQRTNRVTDNIVRDFYQVINILWSTVAIEYALEDFLGPAGSFAARSRISR